MYTVTCESTCDLNYDYLQQRNCKVVFYNYNIDGVDFEDNMGRDKNALTALYAALQTQKPTTSQINEETYKKFFREQLAFGDVLHLAFSSGLSQSIQNAYKAAKSLAEENCAHKVIVLDTLCGGGGYGLFVDGVLDKRDSGLSFKELCTWAENNRLNIQMNFFTTDLTYFRRSGRVSGPVMLLGNLLHLCPLMRVKADGKIVAYGKVMSARKAMMKIIDAVEQNAVGGVNYNGKLWIQHSNCLETALRTKEELMRKFPNAQDVRVMDIGTVMTCHCGPNTVAVYYTGYPRGSVASVRSQEANCAATVGEQKTCR